MIVVIFMEQWLKDKKHINSIIGIVVSVICLIAFGANNFIIPAMIGIIALLTLGRRTLDKEEL